MTFKFNYPEDFSPESRVWVYQTNRVLSAEEVTTAKAKLDLFTANWLSHADKVKGGYMVIPDGFIILYADIAVTEVSGCSTDSSVRVIKELEAAGNFGLFDRQILAFIINEEMVRIPLSKLTAAISENKINPDTLYFNNMVQTLADLKTNWQVPAGNSWLSKKFIPAEKQAV
jgi:hypothetical protein